MGVKRAMALARKAASREAANIYTYGPLIHNPQELSRLKGKGIIPFGEKEAVPDATVLVRAHGVTPETLKRLKEGARNLIDATCPKVSSIQKRIEEYSGKGYATIIAGDPDHPEVVGLLGYARGPAHVVRSSGDIDALPAFEKVLLVSQTTQDELKYRELKERFLRKYPGGEALDTICSSTHQRQEEIRRMVGEVDAMVVVGGLNSANTRRLYIISREAGLPAFHVETAAELPLEELKGMSTVGVTAGASTPQWIVEEVIAALEKL